MASKFAERTDVSVSRSREEIERLIRAHGARKVGSYTDEDSAVVSFQTAERTVKFAIPLPQPPDEEVTELARKQKIAPAEAQRKLFDREERRRWRSLNLVIKARLTAVEDGVETFDEAFLAHIVTPGGKTILEEIRMIEKSSGQRLLTAEGSEPTPIRGHGGRS